MLSQHEHIIGGKRLVQVTAAVVEAGHVPVTLENEALFKGYGYETGFGHGQPINQMKAQRNRFDFRPGDSGRYDRSTEPLVKQRHHRRIDTPIFCVDPAAIINM